MPASKPSELAHPPYHPLDNGELGDPILDAAARCISRKSLDNTSLEEVAAEAGISRTTLYRRYGSRENLFSALLSAHSAPFREWTAKILSGEGTVAERIETVFAQAVLEVQRVGWLDSSIRSGSSPLAARLMIKSFAQSEAEGIGLAISTIMRGEDGNGDGEGGGDISTPEVLQWMGRQMIDLAAAPNWDEGRLRDRVRFFIVPVVVRKAPAQSTAMRLAAVEAKLDRLLAAQSGHAKDSVEGSAPVGSDPEQG